MTPITIFLINLDRSKERLAFVERQAEKIGFQFERIPAVEGKNIPQWLQSEFPPDGRMSPGQVGCYASHLVIAQTMVARELPYAIVLEDDAELSPDFVNAAVRALEKLPPEWDYVHLSSNFKKSVIRVADLGTHSLVRYSENPANTAAYILSNRGARKWLNPMPRIRPNDLDNRFAWQQGLKIYGIYPAPVTQSPQFESQLGRPTRRPNWEPDPLTMMRGRLWNMREVGGRSFVAALAMNAVNSVRKRLDGVARIAVIDSYQERPFPSAVVSETAAQRPDSISSPARLQSDEADGTSARRR
jgi:glycosyl transferase, family 25